MKTCACWDIAFTKLRKETVVIFALLSLMMMLEWLYVTTGKRAFKAILVVFSDLHRPTSVLATLYPFDLADYSNDCGLLSPTYSDPTTAVRNPSPAMGSCCCLRRRRDSGLEVALSVLVPRPRILAFYTWQTIVRFVKLAASLRQ